MVSGATDRARCARDCVLATNTARGAGGANVTERSGTWGGALLAKGGRHEPHREAFGLRGRRRCLSLQIPLLARDASKMSLATCCDSHIGWRSRVKMRFGSAVSGPLDRALGLLCDLPRLGHACDALRRDASAYVGLSAAPEEALAPNAMHVFVDPIGLPSCAAKRSERSSTSSSGICSRSATGSNFLSMPAIRARRTVNCALLKFSSERGRGVHRQFYTEAQDRKTQ